MYTSSICFPLLVLLCFANGQFFPAAPDGVRTVRSTWSPGITVSFKDTTSLCETTPNVKSFSGYVKMSASALAGVSGLSGYDANYFYWFFESRKDPQNAPFVIWIGGGPGFSSVASAVQENGPCNVNDDSNSTTLNPWSWNNEANIIYIDQPSMSGYSFDVATNATVDAVDATLPITPGDFSEGLPAPNDTLQVGTFGSQNPLKTANSTGNAAVVFWMFAQAWMAEFKQYRPKKDQISIWTESYGGRYGPLFSKFLGEQNKRIASGNLQGIPLKLDTIGIVNGYVDPEIHSRFYPEMAFNNTYNVSVPKPVYESMKRNLTMSGGCIPQIRTCNGLASADMNDTAVNTTTDGLCAKAFLFCQHNVQAAFVAVTKRSQDDITHPTLDPFPPQFYTGFFNQHWVQNALGARVNFTTNSVPVLSAFVQTGDLARAGALDDLAELLDSGVQVALMYGDRDYQVNWLGGEQVSLAIPWKGKKEFQKAGYTAFRVGGAKKQGGVVRQVGGLSFTRVFEAGHAVPAYQPEVAFRIFQRAMKGVDIAEGKTQTRLGVSNSTSNSTLGTWSLFSTTGLSSSFGIKNQAPIPPLPICYTWAIGLRCTEEQIGWLKAGTAIVKDFIVVGNRNDTSAQGNGTTSIAASNSTVSGSGIPPQAGQTDSSPLGASNALALPSSSSIVAQSSGADNLRLWQGLYALAWTGMTSLIIVNL